MKVRCGELLREPGAAERLANIWGSGAGLVLEETKAAMGRLLKVGLRLSYLLPSMHLGSKCAR